MIGLDEFVSRLDLTKSGVWFAWCYDEHRATTINAQGTVETVV